MTAFNTNIAGINMHSGPGLVDTIYEDEPLILKREPDNPYDKNAVSVYYKQYKLGYIPAVRVSVVARIMDSGKPMYAKFLHSGKDKKYIWAEMRVYEDESENLTPAKERLSFNFVPPPPIPKAAPAVEPVPSQPPTQPKKDDSGDGLSKSQRTVLWLAIFVLFSIFLRWCGAS